MSLIGASTCADALPAKALTVSVDEVLPGDLMRDQGVLREVLSVSPSVVEWAVRVVFSPVDGCGPGLTVPLFEPVTVWRVGGDG